MRAPAPAYAADRRRDRRRDARRSARRCRARAIWSAKSSLTVDRDALVEAMTALRDTPGLEYQQLMEIAGVDYPERPERFDVVYCLLSLTRNHRIRVHVLDRRSAAGAVGHGHLAGRRLARARSVRHVRRAVQRQCRPAPHPDRLRLSAGIRSARISRCRAMSSCAIRKRPSASSMSRCSWRRISATSTS